MLGEDMASAASMIRSVDKNGDGQIDFDEFLDLWLKREGDEQAHEIEQHAHKIVDMEDLPPGMQRRK